MRGSDGGAATSVALRVRMAGLTGYGERIDGWPRFASA